MQCASLLFHIQAVVEMANKTECILVRLSKKLCGRSSWGMSNPLLTPSLGHQLTLLQALEMLLHCSLHPWQTIAFLLDILLDEMCIVYFPSSEYPGFPE